MSWWDRLKGANSESRIKPQRLDYLNEALALERQGDYDAALTSYRLALRDKPDDWRVMANMAIAFTKTGRREDAIRAYRRALEIEPNQPAAHYGLAFLLKHDDPDEAVEHLEAFLAKAPKSAAAEVQYARDAIARLRAGADSISDPAE